MDPTARSAVYVDRAIPSRALSVPAMDVPLAGTYYWGIHARDRFGKTDYTHGGVFTYDTIPPTVDRMVPMSGNIKDDPLRSGHHAVFGPGHMNSKGEVIGRPDCFMLSMSDNHGLRFGNGPASAERLMKDDYPQPEYAASGKVLYFYGGQYEDVLPEFVLFADRKGESPGLGALNGRDEVTFYVIPDGPIPDGQYHFYVIASDMVRWCDLQDYFFEVDLTPPDAPTDIVIESPTYVDGSGGLYLMEGMPYAISVTAPSSGEDGSMKCVEFQQSASNQPSGEWETIGTDRDVSDTTYSITWTPDSRFHYLRAIAYDYVNNHAISQANSDFHVDGDGPESPFTLLATLDTTFSPKVTIRGYVLDRIVEGQTSGVDHVILWYYNEVTGTMSKVMDGSGHTVKVEVIDYQFNYEMHIDAIDEISGDVSHAYFAQAFDNVGNPGDMSDMAVWTNTGRAESIRVITPATIREIPLNTNMPYADDSRDEIRSLTVTFVATENDNTHQFMAVRPTCAFSFITAEELGLQYTNNIFDGYFELEASEGFTDYEAQITVEFHVSSRSQLGTKTSQILENVRMIRNPTGTNDLEVLELAGGRVQPVDEEKGLYRVQARVSGLGRFALIMVQPDLTIKMINLGASPAVPSQEVTITVIVHNGETFPRTADNVKVKLFVIDESNNQEYIGEIELGRIDPEVDYYPEDHSLGKGDKAGTITWTTPCEVEYPAENMIIKVQVDPDGFVRETSEVNNEEHVNIEVVNSSKTLCVSSFDAAFSFLLLAVFVSAGLNGKVRKKE